MVETQNHQYICTNCGETVRAKAFKRRAFPNGFHVACGCTSLDACPSEMTQAETPDSWRIERPACCEGIDDISELEVAYGDAVATDYRCPVCEAGYRWDGTMSEFPTETTPTTDDEQLEIS